jgi:hypothetical protein
MNPCGRAVDWIQFPFEVDAKVHNSADAPIVRLRWVYTDQPFLPVGTGSVINNRIWNKDQVSMLTVGQLPVKESNFDQDERLKLPAALVPGHMCHPEWFATGEPWPTDLPPTPYGPDGIPECCGLFVDPTEGGIELGGEAGDVQIITPGDNCLEPALFDMGAEYGASYPGGTAEQWWQIPVPAAPGTYHITLTSTAPALLVALLRGVSCAFEIDRFTGTFADGCGSAAFGDGGTKFIHVRVGASFSAGPAADYTIRVDPGPC